MRLDPQWTIGKHFDNVISVFGKVVFEDDAATGSERESFNALVLSKVRRDAEGISRRRRDR